MHAASRNGNVDIVKLLINKNCNIELEVYILAYIYIKTLTSLKKYNFQDIDGDRAIHHAAYGNETKVIEILYQLGSVDLNSKNKKQQTALHIAVNQNNQLAVETLLEQGAQVSLQDREGDTPLHDAITIKNKCIINLLLDYNADLSIGNNQGFNPIHYAALRANTRLVVKCNYSTHFTTFHKRTRIASSNFLEKPSSLNFLYQYGFVDKCVQ